METKILVTDDDPMILRMAEMFLTKAGYQVLKAESGTACLEILRKEAVSMILLDVEMPGLSGIDTLMELKKTHLADGIPLYFLSGSEETEEKVRAGEYPAEGFIRKPFLPAALVSAVQDALA